MLAAADNFSEKLKAKTGDKGDMKLKQSRSILVLLSLTACTNEEPQIGDDPYRGIVAFEQGHLFGAEDKWKNGPFAAADATFFGKQTPPDALFASVSTPTTPATRTGAGCSLYDLDGYTHIGGTLSAGEITISNGGGRIVLAPRQENDVVSYDASNPGDTQSLPRFPDGSRLEVTAKGAEVRAFSAAITLPPALNTLESLGDDPFVVSLSAGAMVTWTAADSDFLELSMTAWTAQGQSRLVCPLEDIGSYRLSPEVLTLLPAIDDPENSWDLTITRINRSSVVAGDHRVALLGIQQSIHGVVLIP